MTDDRLKLTLSIAGLFLGGVTLAYGVLPDKSAIGLSAAIALVMGGMTAISGYLTGYTQKNPRNNKTAEDLLDSIKGSALSGAVKAQVAPALAREAAKPPGFVEYPKPPAVPRDVVTATQAYESAIADLVAEHPPHVATAWSSLEAPEVQAAARASAARAGVDGLLLLDCAAVARFAAAPTLEKFHQLPATEQAAWRLYVAEVARRELPQAGDPKKETD